MWLGSCSTSFVLICSMHSSVLPLGPAVFSLLLLLTALTPGLAGVWKPGEHHAVCVQAQQQLAVQGHPCPGTDTSPRTDPHTTTHTCEDTGPPFTPAYPQQQGPPGGSP